MTETNAVVRRYVEIWNQPDGALRAKAAAELLTGECRFVDPIADVTGPDGLAAVIGGVHERFPGHRIRPIGEADNHHDVLRFSWELVPDGGGESVVIGTDVLTLTGDGQVEAISGFFDKVPTAS
ncbi:nuclear transport factor 2 family protein [Kutzneria sp. NPDC051319]|uniref:nuclear transport factor 2 family protein n=1 Tax=Kutzneria sp. NPDC051319 TaxID=3155047 RepID=UPI003424703F